MKVLKKFLILFQRQSFVIYANSTGIIGDKNEGINEKFQNNSFI